jgi:hypothetical protein
VGAIANVMTVPGAIVTICNIPAAGAPCTNTVPIYSDLALTQAINNPINADAQGRYGFYIAPGIYSETVQKQSGSVVGTYILSLNTIGINASPDASQTIIQPAGSMLSANVLNGMANAATFAGGDIGAKINAAIVFLSGHCGTVLIPSGIYTQTTPVVKPACINIEGQGATSTILTWTPTTGAAFVIADAVESYPQGAISDLRLVGPGTGTAARAIYIGGDPAGVLSPGASFGDHQNFNRMNIQNFGIGVQWGNNAWDNSFHESVITSNGTGLFFPGSVTNSGESISFIATSIQNNAQGINLVGYSDFYFYGSRCDYNDTCGTVTGAATAHFFGMHFEQGSNTILTIGATTDPRLNVFIDGGQMLLSLTTGTDPQMINVVSGSAGSLRMTGTMVQSYHPVTNFVNWATASTTNTLNLVGVLNLSDHGTIPLLTNNCAFAACSIKHVKYTVVASASSVAANTCAFQDMGVPGVRSGDLVASVTKLTAQAGLAVIGAQYAAVDHVNVQFCNVTASTIFPTTGDTYTFLIEQ